LSRQAATEEAFLEEASQHGTLHVISHGFFEAPNVRSITQVQLESVPAVAERRVRDPFSDAYLPGLLSGIVLAGANEPPDDFESPSDGILRATEIEATSLQGVDLVVLSACETGLGAVAGGEGLTGLQRAFQVAGARAVIASLWKVPDRATQELMTQFYTNLWIRKQSKLDALRNAQLYILRNPVLPDGTQLTRSVRPVPITVPREPRQEQDPPTADPWFWAAWTLSGDWR
jgi:CHAT domain-containing protein